MQKLVTLPIIIFISFYFLMIKFLGISALIFTGIFYLLYFMIVPKTNRKITPFGIFFMIVALLLSGYYAIYLNPVFRILNVLIIPGSILLSVLFFRNEKLAINFSTILQKLFSTCVIDSSIAAISYPKVLVKRTNLNIKSRYQSIIKGLIISLPFLFIITALLMEADEVFRANSNELLENLTLINGEVVIRLIAATIFTCYFYGLMKSLITPEIEGRFKVKLNIRLDVIMIATLLVLLNVLYTVFTYTQIVHLYFQVPSDAPGFTYANYARNGFFQLVFVAFINLVLITVLKLIVKTEKKLFLNSLYALTTAYTINMVISAYYKMSLYIDSFGQTRLRIMVSVFTILLGVLLIYLLIYIFTEKSMFVYGLCTCALFYVFLNYVNIDQVIVKHNLYVSERPDYNYLMTLSEDATPEISDAYEDKVVTKFFFTRWNEEKTKTKYRKVEHWYQYNYMDSISK